MVVYVSLFVFLNRECVYMGSCDTNKKIVALATIVTGNDDNMGMVLGMLIMVVLVTLVMNFVGCRKYVYYYLFF
jgi:hypothetical protein